MRIATDVPRRPESGDAIVGIHVCAIVPALSPIVELLRIHGHVGIAVAVEVAHCKSGGALNVIWIAAIGVADVLSGDSAAAVAH